MPHRHAVFLLNLLQDVNILRPLVLLVAQELDARIMLLVSDKFAERDMQGLWQAELQALCAETGASSQTYGSEFDALRELTGKGGVLVAASESNLSAHATTHNVFRIAPPSFLRVTLQHGFECVGFLQNRDHSRAHGRNVSFAADVICGWCVLPKMIAVAPSERSKYLMTGPPSLLLPRPDPKQVGSPQGGLVCENLHSVRMRTSGNFQATFMDTFNAFCAELGRQGRQLAIRPHPGGQYIVKNNVALPENVELDNRPMYQVDLRQYAYGLSAPSSVIIDMVLAGIPTAVWQDEDGVVDTANYEGLSVVSTLTDWLAFERDAQLRPELFARRQERFLHRSGMLTDPALARRQFLGLMAAGLSRGDSSA